jgi:acyl carrier protein
MSLAEIEERVIMLAQSVNEKEIIIERETELEAFLNSITYIKFIIACEDEFDMEIEDDELDMSNFEHIKDIITYISTRLENE